MVSRADEVVFRRNAGQRTAARPATATLSIGQRALFAFALITFGLASSYTAIALLTRVTPALFPGKTLGDIRIPGVSDALDFVPSVLTPPEPSANSSVYQRINLLIMGADARPYNEDATNYEAPTVADTTRTDTILVATIDPLTKQVNLLSFPRDLWIDIRLPGSKFVYKDRINASYAAGVQAGGTFDSGARQLASDIEANFGIQIDNWVWLEFKGVEKLINGIGGIDLEVTNELQVPNYPGQWYYSDDDINARYVEYRPGLLHLDGYDAVAFGRYRDDSDLNRVKRQQAVIEAAVAKIFANGLQNNPLDLWNAYKSTVRTDMTALKVAGLTPLLQAVSGKMTGYSLGDPVNGKPTVWGWQTDAGASVLLWDRDNVQYIINQAFTKAKYSQSSVEIEDGTGLLPDTGGALAQGLGRYLKFSKGLPKVDIGPDAAAQPTTSIILYTENFRPMAEDVAKWLGLPTSAVKSQAKPNSTAPDVLLVIGKDFKLPGN
ncbi:MAG: LCP family protein [Chloroflexi bacterium]|nr:LCP family protein [Chloroflexota bacterium]